MNDITLETSLQAGRSVSGVAQLDDFLYVVCSESDVIQVFSLESPFNRLTDIVVPGMDDANDIAVCSLTRHLYVADWGYHCVWKLPLSRHHPQSVDACSFVPRRWVTSVSPWALSVNETKGGSVLVTPRVVVDEQRCKRASLYIFDADGSLVDDIGLPESVNPEHAVETPRHTVVVCYTIRQVMDDGIAQRASGICELERNGYLIRRFEDKQKETLLWPRHVAIFCQSHDSSSDTVKEALYRFVVTDFNGGRVLEFNERLEMERIVLSAKAGDQIEHPRRIFCNSTSGKFIVGQFNGSVGVYNTVKIASICT